MSSPSNLYAEKVFAEHPLVLWALDDKADYVSLISESQRNLVDWTVSGGTAENTSTIDEPFINSYVTRLTGSVPSGASNVLSCIGNDLFNFTTLNPDLGTFSVGSYIYSLSPYISGIDIGYQYHDSTTGSIVEHTKHIETVTTERWMFVSETFQIPIDNTTMRPVLRISYLHGSEDVDDYVFFVNGVTVGQWSEEFNSTSLGIQSASIPSSINLPALNGIEARAYGLQENSGYYIFDESSLSAKNSSIPMVYGASNSTLIIPNDNNNPSLILPGQGFLNEYGKHKDYTLEMWLRINSDSPVQRRIFGPISSTDGLYVNGPFITLKIGSSHGSFSVSEWTRPMLVHIRLTKNSASLLINGEQVISLNFLTTELEFPSKYTDGKDNDWLGFYGYEDVSPIEVDCVAVYPYQVPIVVAKKRFIYGQGVEIPENINTAYSGTSIFIDYPFANYTNNYSYPNTGKWSQGVINNLKINNNVLSVPEHVLPRFVSSSKTLEDLYTDNSTIQNEENLFMSFKPEESWDDVESHIVFDTNTPLTSSTASIYGVFKRVETAVENQVLIRIEDQSTGNYLSIDLLGSTVNYNLMYNSVSRTIYSSFGIPVGEIFPVGIHINNFANYYGGNVASLLGNRGSLVVYFGGTKNFTNTFTGKMYSSCFDNVENFAKIDYLFNDNGAPKEYENIFDQFGDNIELDGGDNASFWEYILDGGTPSSFASSVLASHRASYYLTPWQEFDRFEFDINISGSWEDNLPLTYFAKYVTDRKGNQSYDLDFLQFNINYPAPSKYVEAEQVSSWTYGELRDEYQNPVQRNYESLDNHLFTGYNDYQDLATRSSKSYSFDTSNSLVKTYISFQYTETGANAKVDSFTYTVSPSSSGIVKPGTYVVDVIDNVPVYDSFLNTKYEVVNNTIIYPPQGIDFQNLSIVVYVDVQVDGILHNSLKIRSLEFASQSFNSSANEVGTRFGTPIYPYKKSGIYYDYETENPFTIYKGSSPYLYLTRYSGVQVRGTFDPLVNRGLAIPINSTLSDNYKVMAMQIAVRYDQDFFPYAPTQIFEIESKTGVIKFFMVADSPTGKRARVYAVNSNTGQIEDGITFYLNGNIVNDPVLTIKEWSIIGISFSSLLNFSNFVGALRINGPLLVNLISHYKSTNLQEVQTVTTRPWFKVAHAGAVDLNWDFWDIAYKWQGVLVLSSTSYYGANPSDIYKSYAGTNKVIVDDYNAAETNPKVLSFKNYEYNIYSDIQWQSSIRDAV